MGRADIDYCLQSLMVHRVVWQDARFSFAHIRTNNLGGNAGFKTRDRDIAETQWLLRRWGRYVEPRLMSGGTLSIRLNVPRRLPIRWG